MVNFNKCPCELKVASFMMVGGWDGHWKNAFGTFEKGGRSEFHIKRKETTSFSIITLMLDVLKPRSTGGISIL